MTHKFLVVSPPRSGTSSACKMARICGLKSLHVLNRPFAQAVKYFDFFADTPFYSVEFLIGLLNATSLPIKFIYLDRKPSLISKSMDNVGIANYMKGEIANVSGFSFVNDFFSWNSLHNLGLENHKSAVKLIAETYSVPMLSYDFSMGWKPFCDFIEMEVPTVEIPHLNRNKIGEPYV